MIELGPLVGQMKQWRHQIHRHPEIAYAEHRTAELVSGTLRSLGLEVHENIAGTGVVGVLRRGASSRSVALRADMDALPIQELNSFAHRSQIDGAMHACGHDGHTAMLLGAASYLAGDGVFDGTAYFIFQPAEENEGGGRRMVEEGLFERFAADAVYALHNAPGLPAGCFALCPGPMMASFATFECTIHGVGGHSAMPHLNKNPIPVGAEILAQWAGTRDALQASLPINIEVTQFHAGTTWNVIPDVAILSGSVRCFDAPVSDRIRTAMAEAVTRISEQGGVTSDFDFQVRYPVLVNEPACAAFCARVATALVGEQQVASNTDPIMGSEDFAYMLQARPGAYILIGNGEGETGGCMVHNPHYDFNDEILALGANYFIALVETALAAGDAC